MYRLTTQFEGKEYNLIEPFSDELNVEGGVLTEKVGKAGTLKFSIAYGHGFYDQVVPFRSFIILYKDEVPYWHGRVISAECDFYKTKLVICEGELAYLNDSILPVYEYSGNIPEYIDLILGYHNSQVEAAKRIYRGRVEVSDPNGYLARSNKNYPTALEELSDKLIKSYGGYFRTRHEEKIFLDYVYEYGEANTQELRIEENILDYTNKLGGDFYTRLIPLGKSEDDGEESTQLTIASVNDGKIYVDNPELIRRYGIIVKTKEWEEVGLPENLKKKGQADVNAQELPEGFELSAVDLSNIDMDIQMLRLGCRTTAISPFHGLNAEYFLTSKTSYLDTPEKDSVGFGELPKTFTGSAAQSIQRASKKIDKVEQQAYERIVTTGMTITGAKGGYVVIDTYTDDGKLTEPWQILIMDRGEKSKATNVIRMNRNGIGFSTSGYNGPYENAWTIDGRLNANFIRTGSLILGGKTWNTEGAIEVLDSNDRKIGSWDKTGLTVLKGIIQGASAIFGGMDNQNGAIEILNAAGEKIGRWDKDGIYISDGILEVGQFKADDNSVNIGDLIISSTRGEHLLYTKNGNFELSVERNQAYLRLGEDTKDNRTVLTDNEVDANLMHVYSAKEWQSAPYQGEIGYILDAIWTGHDWSLENLLRRIESLENASEQE